MSFVTEIADYPRVLYSADDSVVVNSSEEEEALGETYFRTPWEAKGTDQDGKPVVEGEDVPKRPGRRKAAPQDQG